MPNDRNEPPTPAAIAAAQDMTVDDLVSRITELSTLPHIAVRMTQMAGDPNAGASEVHAIVQADPTMTARVLRAVNCSAHGLRFKITDLQRAIAYLGFQRIRNLAVTASVSDVFKGDTQYGPYRRSALWRHMVAVAVTARMIAARQHMANFNEVFLAGLLHDIGLILEDQYCHVLFESAMNALVQGERLINVERQVLGFDHCLVGQRVGQKWKFPDETQDAIQFHHSPKEYKGKHAPVVACVMMANFLCTLKGITSVGLNLLEPPHWATTTLNLSRDELKVFADDIDHEIEQNAQLFEL